MTSNYNTLPPELSIPKAWGFDDSDKEYFLEDIWGMVLKGNSDLEEYLEIFHDSFQDVPVTDDELTDYFRSVLALRRAQLQALGGVPETNLSRAFNDLNNAGIIARADFTCCGTCASAEIGDERDDTQNWRGYVYFHTQDTDSIFESRSTYIGYGAFVDAHYTEQEWDALGKKQDKAYEQTTLTLMREEVIPVFEKHGITVDWNGSLRTRILLDNVDYVAALDD
ncbi:DUF6891 domain-containing protein [Timonella sp. A28]|uniref:DUF6891 domain-containing protein n=1 Tax=Timonella sp. A28 TaxID=3442640 RepID=UPI003EBEAD53